MAQRPATKLKSLFEGIENLVEPWKNHSSWEVYLRSDGSDIACERVLPRQDNDICLCYYPLASETLLFVWAGCCFQVKLHACDDWKNVLTTWLYGQQALTAVRKRKKIHESCIYFSDD